MITRIIYSSLAVILIPLSLLGCANTPTSEETAPIEIQAKSHAKNPILLYKLTVPRPKSIYSICPDGSPLGSSLSLTRLSMWSCIDISADGKYLLTGDHSTSTRTYESKLWRLSDGDLVRTFADNSHQAPTRFTKDGQYIYGVGTEQMGVMGLPRYGKNYALWKVDDGSLVFEGSWQRFVSNLALSPNRKIVAVQRINQLGLFAYPGVDRLSIIDNVLTGSRIVFSQDGKKLAVSGTVGTWVADQYVYIWNVEEGKLHTKIGKSNRLPYQLFAFSDDGKTLATSSVDSIDLWDVDTGNNIANITKRKIEHSIDHSRLIQSLSFNPQSNKLVEISQFVGNGVASISLWDIKDKSLLYSYTESTTKRPSKSALSLEDKTILLRPWDAMVHPTLGLIIIKYDYIYPTNDSPNDMTISIWKLDDMTSTFMEREN